MTVPLLQLVEEEEVGVGKCNQKKYANSDCLHPIMSLLMQLMFYFVLLISLMIDL